jgi:hypothetical protein
MTKGKRRARRLALYLSSIGIQPVLSASSYKQWAADLQTQYNTLEVGLRKLARRSGRCLVRESGSVELATASLPTPIFIQTQAANSQQAAFRSRSREEQFKYISRRWSALTPPCPSCRMGNGYPKRSWPTREWVEEVWGRQHDRDILRVYACPVQSGFWHLGHIRRQAASAGLTDEISIQHRQLPAIPFETGGHI